MDMTQQQDPSQSEAPPQNPLGLSYENATRLRDAGHISNELFGRIFPTTNTAVANQDQAQDQQPAPPPQQQEQPSNQPDLKETANQVFDDAKTATNRWIEDPYEAAKVATSGAASTKPNPLPEGTESADLNNNNKGQIKLGSDFKSTPQPSMDDLYKAYGPNTQGLDMQAQGIKQAGDAAAGRADEQQAALDKAAKDDSRRILANEEDQNKRQKYLQDQLDAVKQKAQDIGNMEIDPKRLYGHMSTGDKIIAGIALFLGSAPGSRPGNGALNAMNDAIDRDIKLQQVQMQNKKDSYNAQANIYGEMMNLTKNSNAAAEGTRLALLNNAQVRVQQMASKYSGPEAQANAQNLLGQIQQKKDETEMAFKQNIMSQMNAQSPNANLSMLKPEQRKLHVPGWGQALTEKGAEEMNNSVAQHSQVTDTIDQLKTILKTPGKSLSPALRAQAQALAASLLGPLKESFFGAGAKFNETELNLLENVAKDPTKVTNVDSATLASFDTLMDKANKSLAFKAKQAGLTSPTERLGITDRPLASK